MLNHDARLILKPKMLKRNILRPVVLLIREPFPQASGFMETDRNSFRARAPRHDFHILERLRQTVSGRSHGTDYAHLVILPAVKTGAGVISNAVLQPACRLL